MDKATAPAPAPTFVGIDVSKHRLDIHAAPPASAPPSTTTSGTWRRWSSA
jgi:hypothetical protein